MLGTNGKVLTWPPKTKILTFAQQNFEESATKRFIDKPMLLNFMNLSTLFRPSLYNINFFIFDEMFVWVISLKSSNHFFQKKQILINFTAH